MPLATPTLLGTGTNTAAATLTSVVSSSVSPSSNALLVVCIGQTAGADNNVSSITTSLSNVGSWTIAAEIHEVVGAAYNDSAIAWAKVTGAPGTGTVTANFAGGTGYTAGISVVEFASGYHATPTGTTGTATAVSGSEFTVTAGASPAAASTMFGCLWGTSGFNTDNAYAADTGFTELEEGFGWYALGLSYEWQVVYDAAGADSTCVFTRPLNVGASACLVEIVAAPEPPRLVVPRVAVHRAGRW